MMTQRYAGDTWRRDSRGGEPYVVCEDLFKIHKVADLEVVALRGLDLKIRTGEIMAVVGPSGSGKSTLLHILAGYETPSAGRVTVDRQNLLKMSEGDLVDYRRTGIGFVWQQVSRNLVAYLTARQNVELPLLLAGRGGKERAERALELLDFTGLSDRADHTVDRLSGGEQQRVAIATALANNPPLLLADEPTGELDTATSLEILAVLRSVNRTYGATIVIVTHDAHVAERADRVVAIADGKTSTETVRYHSFRSDDPREGEREETAIVDSGGRVRIPREVLDRAGIGERARVAVEDGRVVLRPGEE